MFYLYNFYEKNKIIKISNGLVIIILTSLIFLTINLLFFTPEITGYDEMAKWNAGKQFKENFYIANQHHSMRWGAWITTLFFHSFKNGPLAYYIHNLLILHLSLIIFAYIIFKLAGIIPSIIFLIITHYDEFILWSGFQADITIETFFPLSLVILLVQKNFLKKNLNFLFFIFISFYLYAVKETNLFFLPGILYFVFRYYGLKKSIQFIIIFIFFYFLETILLKYFSLNTISSYGRIFELLNGEAKNEITEVLASEKNATIISVLKIIIKKWNFSNYRLIYIITFIGLLYIFLNIPKNTKKKIEIFIVLITLSFFVFNSFFFISLNPLTPGQDFNYRYNAVIFPICTAFISVIIFKITLLKKFKLIRVLSVLLFLYLIFPTAKFIATGNSILMRHTVTNNELNNIFLYDSFFARIEYYKNLKKIIKNNDYCFASRVHQRLTAVPFILGFYPYLPTYEFYEDEQFIHSYLERDKSRPFMKIKEKPECKKIVNLDLN
jgi:hypothetical protein